MSALSTLNTANTALAAQQRALEVTAQNIANVNTDGYSRQRAELQSIGASTVPAFFSVSKNVGGGVNADTVARIRDSFAENRALAEHATNARYTVQSSAYAQIEDAFREPGENGLQTSLTEMWSSWEDLSTATDIPAARRAVLESTATVVGSLQTTRATLDAQWGQTREDLATLVEDVNAATAQISALNRSIQRASQAGVTTNELADKRDALVLSLAQKVGATASPGVDGMVDVLVGGSALVSGTARIELAVTGATTADELAGSPLAVVTVPGGTKVRVGGTAGGEVDVLSTVIPQYRGALDKTAADLAAAVNAAHATGTDAYGAPGGDLLVSSGGGPVTAANLSVAITDPGRLAASSVPGKVSTDGTHALAMARVGETGGVDSDYRQLITQLGVEASVSTRNVTIQSTITSTVDTNRQAVSGVSLDEEMTQMLTFQHGYQAAARMITAMDELLSTLINNTGLVGR
ncbi:flagellar hook-associated protein FlgK [Modestobacter marinus]|uniref:flagellar hook-associated protein FlgK n=1 Tax=Modestobacter marinus TaxID=477641 RepID=UPI001C96FE5E|nr:flagellar hook-associated protein FlgK [Modestobacter marinus]